MDNAPDPIQIEKMELTKFGMGLTIQFHKGEATIVALSYSN